MLACLEGGHISRARPSGRLEPEITLRVIDDVDALVGLEGMQERHIVVVILRDQRVIRLSPRRKANLPARHTNARRYTIEQ